MGITGLLPFLRGIQRDIHVASFRGRKVAVDAYCWLHKGAYSCAMQLVVKTDKLETLSFIKYCMKRVNMLLQNDVTPVMVFDGGYLPTKGETERGRREKRETYLQKGKALLKEGRKSEANDCFQRCIDVSPEMALALIKECRRIGVECIVAPYEADAQLTYLQKEGVVDLVITEDSDLLVFGCGKVLYKMDDSGHGKLIELKDLGKANKTLVGFTQDSFRQMCILSGCDYLASIPGVGLGKASKYMRKYRQDPYRVIQQLSSETARVPPGYGESFKRAEYTFLYQLVFDPHSQMQVRLNKLPVDVDPSEFEFAGAESSPTKAIGMARGNINPITLRVMDSYSPSKAPPPKSTSWTTAPAVSAPAKQYPLPIQSTIHLSSSKGTSKTFRPPVRAAPTEDNSLRDDELKAIYGTAEEPSCSQTTEKSRDPPSRVIEEEVSSQSVKANAVTLSRFFSRRSSLDPNTEYTPTEGEVRRTDRGMRKLRLSDGIQGADHSMEARCPDSEMERQTGYLPRLGIDSEVFESVPESPVESATTSLPMRRSLSLHNPAKKRLHFFNLSKEYGFSKTAGQLTSRVETIDRPSSLREPSVTGSAEEFRIENATATESHSRGALEVASRANFETKESSSSDQLESMEVEATPCSLDHVHSDSQPEPDFMTSEDFITSAASAQSHSTPLQSGTVSLQSSVDDSDCCIDHTGKTSSQAKPPRQPSMLLQRLTSRRQSSKSTAPKIGLSRRRSSSAFKAPRPSETGLRQTSLLEALQEFTCQKKPRMA